MIVSACSPEQMTSLLTISIYYEQTNREINVCFDISFLLMSLNIISMAFTDHSKCAYESGICCFALIQFAINACTWCTLRDELRCIFISARKKKPKIQFYFVQCNLNIWSGKCILLWLQSLFQSLLTSFICMYVRTYALKSFSGHHISLTTTNQFEWNVPLALYSPAKLEFYWIIMTFCYFVCFTEMTNYCRRLFMSRKIFWPNDNFIAWIWH